MIYKIKKNTKHFIKIITIKFMTSTLLISVLLSIVGFIGVLMVQQLMKIATAVQNIQVEIKGLATDHDNLKADHKDLKERVKALEI